MINNLYALPRGTICITFDGVALAVALIIALLWVYYFWNTKP